MLNVRVMDTGEELAIPDVEPVESAELFWQISDEIWKQKPEKFRLAARFSISTSMPTLEARDALNEVLSEIDDRLFVVSGIGKTMKLRGPRPDDEVELSPEFLDNPTDSYVGTFNWDEGSTWRYADIDGTVKGVEFTDDHKDHHRNLYAGFDYQDENRQRIQLTYGMERIQCAQNHPTSLSMNIWHSQFAETGYSGSQFRDVPLSVEQELHVLRVFQAMGGITLESPTQEQ